MKMNKDIYLREVLAQIQRLLALQDRNISSPTYGSFDRNYWQYHIVDFPSARCQEAALTLRLLSMIKCPENIYYKNKRIDEWIEAALHFWKKIQEKNGSFNEWYPKENSFVATAFSLYAVTETLLISDERFRKKNEHIIEPIEKAATWLSRHEENRAQNQETGAIAALYNVYLLTGKKKYAMIASNKIKSLSKIQNSEGWFSEYGGPDTGYLSLSIDYLAKYYLKTKDTTTLEILNKAIKFIQFFLQPDYNIGGIYSSRNTEYLIPGGFEILSSKLPEASGICAYIRKGLQKKYLPGPSDLDDRYLTYILYTYLQSYYNAMPLKKTIPVHRNYFIKTFKEAGIYIRNNSNFYLIVNCRKGGAFKIYFYRPKFSIWDAGILTFTKKNQVLSASYIADSKLGEINEKGAQSVGFLASVPDKPISTKNMMALRLFQETLGKYEIIGLRLKNRFRKILITAQSKSKVRFTRTVSFFKDVISITDELKEAAEIKKIILGAKYSTIFVPSSRLFHKNELDSEPIVINVSNKNKVKILRNYNKFGKLVVFEIL